MFDDCRDIIQRMHLRQYELLWWTTPTLSFYPLVVFSQPTSHTTPPPIRSKNITNTTHKPWPSITSKSLTAIAYLLPINQPSYLTRTFHLRFTTTISHQFVLLVAFFVTYFHPPSRYFLLEKAQGFLPFNCTVKTNQIMIWSCFVECH